jgi:hypothetical protein
MRTLGFLFATVVGLGAATPSAWACATAPPEGGAVRIADEEALIAWNAETKTEHFVRRASFRSSSDAFGFIVPTPSKPELGEVDVALFDALAENLRPPVVYETSGYDVGAGCSYLAASRSMSAAGADGAAAPAVRVLDEQRVAGFDAVVLSADEPAALALWLKDRGFAQGPSLTEWLTPYVSNKWILTAFKIANRNRGTETRVIGTSAVRMTFKTDRPFYPYREPRDQRETLSASMEKVGVDHRTLRVYFASDTKYEGALDDGGAFPATTKLAGWITTPFAGHALLPERTYLTVFEDASNPRPGTDDVFFAAAKDASPVTVPTIVVRRPTSIVIPLDLVALVALVAGGIVLGVRRLRRQRDA